MTKEELYAKYSKMNSNVLLFKVAAGNFSKKDAIIVATILERRFPTPKSKVLSLETNRRSAKAKIKKIA